MNRNFTSARLLNYIEIMGYSNFPIDESKRGMATRYSTPISRKTPLTRPSTGCRMHLNPLRLVNSNAPVVVHLDEASEGHVGNPTHSSRRMDWKSAPDHGGRVK